MTYTSDEVQSIVQRHLDEARTERLFAMVACAASGMVIGWLAFGACRLAGVLQ